jgi:glycosyltransferase involved in cell wall biosynthesis
MPGAPDAGGAPLGRVRLAVYADQAYRAEGGRVSTNRAFIRFVTGLPPRVAEVVVAGRLDPEPGSGPYPVDGPGVRFVALPHYRRVTSVGRMLRVAAGSCGEFSRTLDEVDAVWIFGPHPLAVAFAAIARGKGVPLALGVRQDYVEFIRNRLPSRWWTWSVGAAWMLDRAFRLLARRAPTVALGGEIARRYRRGGPVLETGFSLVPEAAIVPLEAALARSWEGELRIVSVGRLDPEKNPALLLDVLAGLRDRGTRCRLVVAGDGPLRPDLEHDAAARGLSDAVEFLGEVPNGPALWDVYRAGHLFLHVSLTEGLPQVLFEAHASGLPVVATAVGGVPAAVGHGRTGLLVPPRDAEAAVAAIERLRADDGLRERLIRAGHAAAGDETMERQLDRLASFLQANLDPVAPRDSA